MAVYIFSWIFWLFSGPAAPSANHFRHQWMNCHAEEIKSSFIQGKFKVFVIERHTVQAKGKKGQSHNIKNVHGLCRSKNGLNCNYYKSSKSKLWIFCATLWLEATLLCLHWVCREKHYSFTSHICWAVLILFWRRLSCPLKYFNLLSKTTPDNGRQGIPML